ncbi:MULTISPECIES: alpha/beta hydrolase [unclassified Nocardiopsis]|uniref:alpha/beta fold hydrolase n=1 Tax=unclassified Nocardiopsis TaxID=2649073 RepID=UPI0033FD6241
MLDDSAAYVDGPWNHRTVSAAGARFHVAELGEGPLVLLLHGFPQFWWAWRAQLTGLARAGYRAVAVDLRGYGASDKTPRGYDLVGVAQDMASLVRALGAADAAVVGHGVGGLVGWTMTAYHPDEIRALAAVSAPHPRRAARVLFSGGPGVAHMLRAQVPILPEHRLLADGCVRVGDLLDAWSAPGWPDREAREHHRRAFAIPKVSHCSLEYHRWIFRSRFRADGFRYAWRMRRPVSVPVLQLHGELDRVCPPGVARASRRLVRAPYRWVPVPGAGHFPHEERPDAVGDALVGWLREVDGGVGATGGRGADGERR